MKRRVTDPYNKSDNLSSVPFNVMLQMTKGTVYIVTWIRPDDKMFESS